jgi:hypothetical protein
MFILSLVCIVKSSEIWNFMKIRLVGAELLHEDGRTDMSADSQLPQCCERAWVELLGAYKQIIGRNGQAIVAGLNLAFHVESVRFEAW